MPLLAFNPVGRSSVISGSTRKSDMELWNEALGANWRFGARAKLREVCLICEKMSGRNEDMEVSFERQ